MLIADFEWFEVVDVEMTNIIISSHFIFLLQYLTCLYIWNDFVEGQEMGHVHPLGRVWVHASSAWLSLGKLWKEEGIVIKYLLFIICTFCSCWINWIGLENWIWTAVSPLYYTGLDWTGRISGRISGRPAGREWEETLRRTDSQPTPNPVWANLRSFAHSGWREWRQAMQS